MIKRILLGGVVFVATLGVASAAYQLFAARWDAGVQAPENTSGEHVNFGEYSVRIHCGGDAQAGEPMTVLETGIIDHWIWCLFAESAAD